MDPKWARTWFAVTAAAVVIGVLINVVLSWQNEPLVSADGSEFARFGDSGLSRSLHVFAFFTTQANLIVGATCLLLAINPNRTGKVFAVFRLIGLVSIAVTFIVFHVALAGLFELSTWGQVADKLLHTVVPIMAVVGWIMFGPRDLTSGRIAKLTVLFPAAYMVFTLIRGALVDFYPYPFADVNEIGYARVIINGAWVSLLFVAVAAAATALDKRLTGGRSSAPGTRT